MKIVNNVNQALHSTRFYAIKKFDAIQIQNLLHYRHQINVSNKRYRILTAKVLGEWFIADNEKHTFNSMGALNSSLNYAFAHMFNNDDEYRQFIKDNVEYYEAFTDQTFKPII